MQADLDNGFVPIQFIYGLLDHGIDMSVLPIEKGREPACIQWFVRYAGSILEKGIRIMHQLYITDLITCRDQTSRYQTLGDLSSKDRVEFAEAGEKLSVPRDFMLADASFQSPRGKVINQLVESEGIALF